MNVVVVYPAAFISNVMSPSGVVPILNSFENYYSKIPHHGSHGSYVRIKLLKTIIICIMHALTVVRTSGILLI